MWDIEIKTPIVLGVTTAWRHLMVKTMGMDILGKMCGQQRSGDLCHDVSDLGGTLRNACIF